MFNGLKLSDVSQVMIYRNACSDVVPIANSTSTPLNLIGNLAQFDGVTFYPPTLGEDTIQVTYDTENSILGGCFVLKFTSIPSLQATGSPNNISSEPLLTQGNINMIYTMTDKIFNENKASIGSIITILLVGVMYFSIPHCFILMKLFRTMYFYVFIECNFPSNFSSFLYVISQNIILTLPHCCNFLVDNTSRPLYPRFSNFGFESSIFANLGKIISAFVVLLILKGVLMLVLWLFKGRFGNSWLFKSRLAD